MTRTGKWSITGAGIVSLFLLGGWSLTGTRTAERKAQAGAPDAVKVDPKHYKVELENDRVRVVRISYGPHEKSVMHGHRPGVVLFLTDAHYRCTYPDGQTVVIKGEKGKILWFDKAWAQLPENLNDAPFEAVYI